MTAIANIFSPSASYTIFTVAIAAVIGFFIGFLFKNAVVNKHKKRVLYLEDEMLANHSRILEHEKEIAELKNELSRLTGNPTGTKAGSKVS